MTLLAPLTNSLDPKFFTACVFSRFILENAKKSFSEKYQVRPVLRSALEMLSIWTSLKFFPLVKKKTL